MLVTVLGYRIARRHQQSVDFAVRDKTNRFLAGIEEVDAVLRPKQGACDAAGGS